jgi:glycosyltransferase involved in cell wall biosynthesis
VKDNPLSALPVAVVIPAYLAAREIAGVIQAIPDFVSAIFVVDDHSPDHTAEIVSILAAKDQRIHLICHPANLGVGGAVMSGYRAAWEAGAGIIVKLDSDGQMDPHYLYPLIYPLLQQKADYTKGNRFLHVRELRTMPFMRQLGNLGLSFITKTATGYWNIFDPTNGYTAIRAVLVPLLDSSQIDGRFFFETSLLLELSRLRAVVRDVSIPARYGDETSLLSEKDALFRFPLKLIRGLFHRILIQYFIRDFSTFSFFLLIGSIFTLFGTTWGAYHWRLSDLTHIPATTGTVMIAILPIILGVQFLLQALVVDIQNVPSEPVSLVEPNASFFVQEQTPSANADDQPPV